MGPGFAAKILAFRRSHVNKCSPCLCYQCPYSQNEPQLSSTACPEDPPRSSGRPCLGSVKSFFFFFFGTGAHETCVHSPRVKAVSLSPVKPLQSSLTGLQSQILWRLFLSMPNLHAGEPDIMFPCGRTSSTKLFSSLWLIHLDRMVFD